MSFVYKFSEKSSEDIQPQPIQTSFPSDSQTKHFLS